MQFYFLSEVRGLKALRRVDPTASLKGFWGFGSKRLVSLLFVPVYVRVTLFIPRQIFRRFFFCPVVSRCAGAVLRRLLCRSMKVLRSIIVDDEFSSRRLLARLLSAHAEISVVGKAQSVEEAISLCAQLRPAVIFLDVNMPNQSGFELIALLKEKPDIVFVTAHIDYMSEAFGVGACDYLLKPVSAERLKLAVNRLVALSLGNK